LHQWQVHSNECSSRAAFQRQRSDLTSACSGPTSWDDCTWDANRYREYLELADEWARQWNAEHDVIERVLFEVVQSRKLAIESLLGWLNILSSEMHIVPAGKPADANGVQP